LYGSDDECMKKYYGNKKSNFFEQNKQQTSKEIELIKSNNIKFSDEELAKARKFIQSEEKFSEYAYKPTKNDVWTIGYGHTGTVDGKLITEGMKITKEKAEELYRKDFEAHIRPLKEVEVPLTSNQKIALASFIYNVGEGAFKNSGVFKKLNSGDYEGAAANFDKYVKQKNKITGEYVVLNGLVKRRQKEKELFLTNDKE